MSSARSQEIIQSASDEISSLDAQANASPPNNPSSNSPRPELTTMTNVNVLDLHTNSDSKLYSKESTTTVQYIYSNESNNKLSSDMKIGGDQLINGAVLQRISPGGQVIDGRLVNDDQQQQSQQRSAHPIDQMLTKIALSDEQILRLIGSNGESQQIISREIINGEHHILTRNENGEHIITRIVTADHKLNVPDNAIYTAVTADESNRVETTTKMVAAEVYQQNGEIIYSPATVAPTSVLQYTTDATCKEPQQIYANVTAATAIEPGSVTITTTAAATTADEVESDSKEKSHIIYTHGDKTYVETIKDGHIYDNGKLPIYTTAASTATADDKHLYEKPPIDLIYEDGGKTVIYTTTADPKSLELYAGNELSLISEGQVIVQGGLQYTTQQINGQTVFVVSEQPLEADIASQPIR